MTEGTAENMMLSFRPRRSLSTIALRPPAAAPKVNTDCRGARRYNGLKRSHPQRSLEIVPPGLTQKAGILWSRAPCRSAQQPVDNGVGGCHNYCSALEVQGATCPQWLSSGVSTLASKTVICLRLPSPEINGVLHSSHSTQENCDLRFGGHWSCWRIRDLPGLLLLMSSGTRAHSLACLSLSFSAV